jgi:hypothetical protein
MLQVFLNDQMINYSYIIVWYGRVQPRLRASAPRGFCAGQDSCEEAAMHSQPR